MFKIVMLLTLFVTSFNVNSEAASVLGREANSVLDADLKTLKNNLMALKNKAVFSSKDLITLGYVDDSILDIKNTIDNLDLGKQQYLKALSNLYELRLALEPIENTSIVNSLLGDSLLVSESVELNDIDNILAANNERYLYDTVACPTKYSLQRWRMLALNERRLKAVECKLTTEVNEFDGLYKQKTKEIPGLNGEVVIVFDVSPKGIIEIKNTESGLPKDLVNSMVQSIESIKMPALDSNNIEVTYKLTFSP
jgi:hypothetical protein